jgi:hypothetical protein
MQNLPIQVTQCYPVVVHKGQRPYSGYCQVDGGWGPKPPSSTDKNLGLLKFFLPFGPYFINAHLTLIAPGVIRTE